MRKTKIFVIVVFIFVLFTCVLSQISTQIWFCCRDGKSNKVILLRNFVILKSEYIDSIAREYERLNITCESSRIVKIKLPNNFLWIQQDFYSRDGSIYAEIRSLVQLRDKMDKYEYEKSLRLLVRKFQQVGTIKN